VDFRDTPEEAAFRAEARAWIEREKPPWSEAGGPPSLARRERLEELREWSRRMWEAGYAGLPWPREYGGQGKPITYQIIFNEELARARAPGHVNVIGLGMAGPTILTFGREDQKRRFIPKILSAEEIWCQGFSEPGAGSDLAAVSTRAIRRGDRYIVEGQKIWSSLAHVADWCILLARSDPGSSRHQGLTYLLVDMHSPGITVRPIRQITGDAEFNEIFFDGVEVPAENVLGEEGAGWQVAITTLMHERLGIGFTLATTAEIALARLTELVRRRLPEAGRSPLDPVLRQRFARLVADMAALRFTNYRALTAYLKKGVPGPEASITKLHWSEMNQRLSELALDLEGPYSLLEAGCEWSLEDGLWQYAYLRSRGNTIEGGTSEILRNIVAERVLGLPKSR
jgi:alkylation response protein AidB-like acyl-CoA dehydrogenase